MEQSRIQAIANVELKARPEIADELRWFYSQVALLEEAPPSQDGRPQVCFRSAQILVRICLVAEPKVDPMIRRLTIAVPSLGEAAAQLDERKVPYRRLTGLLFTDRRLETRDPAGYFVEFRRAWPDAPV